MNLKNILLLAFIPLFSMAQKPFDTSTPEKFVEAIGNLGERPANENPLPFLFEDETAKKLMDFDELAATGLAPFEQFRRNIQEKFPAFVLKNTEYKIRISLDGSEESSPVTFAYKIKFIAPLLKERIPSDFKFISATEPDENNISKLTLLIMGEEQTIDIIKTDAGYRYYFSEDFLIGIRDKSEKCKELIKVYEDANLLLESGQITSENFEAEMERIYRQYVKAIY